MKGTLQKENRAEVQRMPETVTPVVNIRETADGYLLEAEMPGVSKDGIEVTLENNEITIVGRRTPETVAGEVLLRESRPVDYRRVFEMDPAIDPARISARIEQGLLTVVLPKSERVKPRRIAVD